MRYRKIMAILACLALLCAGTAFAREDDMNAYQRYLATGEAPSLWETYDGVFSIGVATAPQWFGDEKAVEVIAKHFNSVTCENQMKADFTMDRQATLKQNDPLRVALNFTEADKVLSFARDHGMKVRAHTLVWHSQVPRWFFTEKWQSGAAAKLADRETMIARMENYIRDEIVYINTVYPGLVYAWDVVNEAIEPAHGNPNGWRMDDSLWYQTIGDDFVELAFTFARKYAAPDQKLFYNDYNCYQKDKIAHIRTLLRDLHDKGVLDGLGMQSHLTIDYPTLSDYETALTLYASLGITIHVTELDIRTGDDSPLGQMRLAARYRGFFAMLKRLKENAGLDIENVTIWGLTDNHSWLNNAQGRAYPLLFDDACGCKPAFFGAIQDSSIPLMGGDAKLQEAIDKLGFKLPGRKEEDAPTVTKTLQQHNPVMTQRFGADPWAMVYDGRVYLYMTGDQPVTGMDGRVKTNDYSNINTLRVVSSDDLVNWTDHGDIPAAGKQGAAKWAGNSWAPCAAWKTIDGRDQFFLYFANSGGGIGVLTADSPVGPFEDPLGKPLVSRATPSCAEVTWLFDPAVLVDDDGQAYLYFGGGIPKGMEAAPGTARVAKLGADMISLDGDPRVIDAPWLFEDSGINRFDDTYAYSYCSNFNVPAGGSEQGFGSGEIVYMTSDDPMGPFRFAGRVLKNPGSYFGVGGNNHHSMFEFQGEWYIAYHAATLDRDLGYNAGYRSTFVDALRLDEKGLPTMSEGTMTGVRQVKPFDPYAKNSSAALCALAGAETRPQDDGGMAASITAPGGWLAVAGADFGPNGAQTLEICWKSDEENQLSVLLDDPSAKPAFAQALDAAEGAQTARFPLNAAITGAHDIIFRFDRPGATLLWWRFLQ